MIRLKVLKMLHALLILLHAELVLSESRHLSHKRSEIVTQRCIVAIHIRAQSMNPSRWSTAIT
jgi:hypothetical protein